MTYTATIDGTKIIDWDTFHEEFQRVMGFFDGYGKNMDAWIDCMYDMFIDGGLTKFNLQTGDIFILKICDAEDFKRRCPEVFSELIACTALLNKHRDPAQIYLKLC